MNGTWELQFNGDMKIQNKFLQLIMIYGLFRISSCKIIRMCRILRLDSTVINRYVIINSQKIYNQFSKLIQINKVNMLLTVKDNQGKGKGRNHKYNNHKFKGKINLHKQLFGYITQNRVQRRRIRITVILNFKTQLRMYRIKLIGQKRANRSSLNKINEALKL